MSAAPILAFLRRELAPTPGRASATLRLTLACIAATIPILTHHIPHALLVMIVMYLITQEDTAATLIGSILAVVGVTVGLGIALLALQIALDIPWLRICFLALFLFGGLFLKRVLAVGALGSAIGLPAALVMIFADILPPQPEIIVEFVLWIWWCVALGLSVNVAVQLLLSPGDPLMLLRREMQTRLLAVEQLLRRMADDATVLPPAAALNSLAIAGMSRPLALLKTAAIVHPWARNRHEKLAGVITLTDRLVTSAVALEAHKSLSGQVTDQERLLRVANGCEQMRRAFDELRLPAPGEWRPLSADLASSAVSPLSDIERTLDELVFALPGPFKSTDDSEAGEKRNLFLPDAFDNIEYVRFAVKGALAALICYFCFIGFDYPGIYTSVITCFVVSLSSIGASNQKGILRFGGAAVGGGLGLIALVYLLPNCETIGGFWLVFGAGTAVAAWINFGTPRISYGGYQTGLAFYKAILQGFGPALSATVVRDRLIGVFFGLTVFGILELLLWPVRATDRMRERLADMLCSLADLALMCTRTSGRGDVDTQRNLISQQVADIQGFIESSKFESDEASTKEIERLLGYAQSVFLILLPMARNENGDAALPGTAREAATQLDSTVARVLTTMAELIRNRQADMSTAVDEAMGLLERSVDVFTEHGGIPNEALRARLVLYHELVVAIKRLALACTNNTREFTAVAL